MTMMNRSIHIPMLTNSATTQSAAGLLLIRLDQRNCGAAILQAISAQK